MKFLHIARREANGRIWLPEFVEAVKALGELEIIENADEMSDGACANRIRRCDVLITGWDTRPVPMALAADRGNLAYICHVTGEMRRMVPLELIEAGIPVTNWGDAPSNEIAEGAMVLLLAMLKNLRLRIETVSAGGWRLPGDAYTGTLEDLNVGVYGCGVIGRRFIEMLRPFRSVIRVFDPFVEEMPEGCARVADLDDLFRLSDAIVIHAGLTDETRESVNAERLAMLPDNGIVINTARGGIVDQDALFAELESGRLLAALDVLTPDKLPDDHPARQWPNAVFTAHTIGAAKRRGLHAMHRICLDNLRRFIAGQPLRFVMDRERYLLST